MKTLLLGNEAVARGLYEAGCKFISSYPGTPSTEITESAATYGEIYAEWAPNEKVAMESAFGASLGGARSFCAMKHVGLNVAADPLFTISYTGVNAGMVIAVADDAGMHSSQNEQDSRRYAIAAKIPMLEPADSAEALLYTKTAYEISEKFDTPVIIKMCTRVAHSQSVVNTSPREEKENTPYKKDAKKYVMMPAFAKPKHPFAEQRLIALREYGESSFLNRIELADDSRVGIICDSTSYQYVKEVFSDSVNVLKIGLVNPLPDKLIENFASLNDELYVIEELDGVIEEHVRSMGISVTGKQMFPACGEFSQNLIRSAFKIKLPEGNDFSCPLPVRPPAMCAGCPHRGMFYILKKNNITVLGDIGCYTLGATAPLNAMDSTICMGASVSSLHGFIKANDEAQNNSVAVIGDSTFVHSGMSSLVNVAYNSSNATVIVLDNSITGMTGHQQNPTTGVTLKGDNTCKVDLEAFVKSIGIKRVRVVDPYDLKACESAVKEELAANEPSVIISRRPCVLLKYVKHSAPVKVDKDKCKGCASCMKIGCPAVSMTDKKALIDTTLCVGCKVCTQLCKFGALESGEAKK